MPIAFISHTSFALLAAASIVAFAVHGWWLYRQKSVAPPLLVWGVAVVLLAITGVLVQRAGERERREIQLVTSAFARLYAAEFEMQGHHRLPVNVRSDDPLYLQLIAMQKGWLALNPGVNDIYTMRRLPDGRAVFVVDSETDYDHNGVLEGEREARTVPGEVYPAPDPGMIQAFGGRAAFDAEPVSDRWGTWVSAYVPLRAPDGSPDGFLGIDFDARSFLQRIAAAEDRVVGLMAIPLVILLGSSTLIAVMRSSAQRQAATEAELRSSEEKLRQIIEHSDQVFYAHLPDGRITYVSPQARHFFDAELEEVMRPWTDFLTTHPANAEGERLTNAAIQTGQRQGRYVLQLRSCQERVFWAEVNESPVVVNGRTVAIVGALTDITERKRTEEAVQDLNAQLVDASRRSGMAEVASNLLHNLGNVLNSLNVAATVASETIRKFKVSSLQRVAEMLAAERDLPAFLAHNPRGVEVPSFLTKLAAALGAQQGAAMKELDEVRLHVEHINEVVAIQQRYTDLGGRTEVLPVPALVEDALRLNTGAADLHDLRVVRSFADVPPVNADRHRVLQILGNLIQNARHSLAAAGSADKCLTLGLVVAASGRVAVSVADNGLGISAGNLMRIFTQGFTTRVASHGFGLHESANAAREMGGSLNVQSDGLGCGAVFTLELPVAG